VQRQSSSISHHVQQYRYTDEVTKAYHFQLTNPRRIMLASGQRPLVALGRSDNTYLVPGDTALSQALE
jgi:hypothetical protein